MFLDFTKLDPREAYGWMADSITPRPIAWVSTISPEGRTNLAPFSFFNGITGNPPTLMFSAVNLRDGTKKDTVRNIEATGQFVVNLVSHALAEKMNACAALLPYGESEFDAFGIAQAVSERVKPPRVAEAPVSFECTLHTILPIGEGAGAANVVFGRIVAAHVTDGVLGVDGEIDPALLDTVGRLGGDNYATTRDRFDLRRPDRPVKF
ncbi:flavin reductase family protein [Rariglobus hedericola]|uniref:Flavin reductase family protein n=1 Tax=Rariglobus hedericola TaxID=2597822 RepID=A0A556QK79_9BACT|nr:flavin reductase family protein [Rariglobus hedericola]TSJ77054.1 flavin reductase family protein [Rariglobus hedericola]